MGRISFKSASIQLKKKKSIISAMLYKDLLKSKVETKTINHLCKHQQKNAKKKQNQCEQEAQDLASHIQHTAMPSGNCSDLRS